mgnify:CR=1 FL=1
MEFEDVIEKWLEAPLLEVRPLSGGDINQVSRLRLANSKELVLKLNSKDLYPGMFEKESAGLRLLRSAGCRVPGVELTFVEGAHQFLILEYVDEGRPRGTSWELFGRQLATLHLQTNGSFGLDHDNYIGSLDQKNDKMHNWTEFFISNRLEP